jgi:hypothetical protein
MSLVNQKELLKKIMSKSVVKGGVGPINNSLSRKNISSPAGNTRVELPGNCMMNDIAFFGQPNPFGDLATVRFKSDMNIDAENASPFPTYFQSVVLNDAYTPIINQGKLAPQEMQTVQDMAMEKTVLVQAPRVATTQIFPQLTQNKNTFLD